MAFGAQCAANAAVGGILFAHSAIFRREDQLLPEGVVVACGPSVIATLFQEHDLLGRQRRFFVGFVEVRPVGMQLVPSVLRYKQATLRIHGKALGVANASGEAFGRRKCLVGLIRLISPDASASLEFPAWRQTGV